MRIKQIIIFITLMFLNTSCKSQLSDYEKRVYNLINDAYVRNPKYQISSENAFIDQNHNLENSKEFVKSDLFKKLIVQEFNYEYPLNDSVYSNLQKDWTDFELKVSSGKIDQKYLEHQYLKIIEKKSDKPSIDPLIPRIEYILFKDNYAIIVYNVDDWFITVNLYVKDSLKSKFRNIGSVSDPPRADE